MDSEDDMMDADEVESLDDDFYSGMDSDANDAGDADYEFADNASENSEELVSNRHQQHYTVLSEADIRQRQEDDIVMISNVLSISKVVASILLRHYNWSVSKVHDEWFADEEKVRSTVGLLEKQVVESPIDTELTCGICFETYPCDRMNAAACGHSFCTSCWAGYISTSINDGPGCLMLRCPDPSCVAVIGHDMIDILVSEEDKEKYFRYFLRSYIEDNRKTKWCPAPGCDYAVDFTFSSGNYDVSCRCSYSFCWNCTEEAHRPVDCDTVAKWILKNSAESENMNWILANSKPCPKCKRPIEKNQGCMHITCTPPCKFEFCCVIPFIKQWPSHLFAFYFSGMAAENINMSLCGDDRSVKASISNSNFLVPTSRDVHMAHRPNGLLSPTRICCSGPARTWQSLQQRGCDREHPGAFSKYRGGLIGSRGQLRDFVARLCLGAWSDHGESTGGFYACNRYETAKQEGVYDEDEKRRKMARILLERYTHYYERWATNQSSRQKALADLEQMQDVHIEKLSDKQCQPESQLKFIIDAWQQIVECRRVLKWTYAYGYYIPEDELAKREFFEYLQGEAESGLERLHQCAEKELEPYLHSEGPLKEFNDFRTKLAGLTSVTRNYFENLVRALENGLSDVDSEAAAAAAAARPPVPSKSFEVRTGKGRGLRGRGTRSSRSIGSRQTVDDSIGSSRTPDDSIGTSTTFINDSVHWACQFCTFVNDIIEQPTVCSMCENPRGT